MKNKQILILVSLIVLGIVGYFFLIKENPKSLVTPLATSNNDLTSTQSSTPTPVVFKFDSTTDLNSELQTVSPNVETSDFDRLKQIISSL